MILNLELKKVTRIIFPPPRADVSKDDISKDDISRADYIGSAEGHEYPDLQVGDEVNPRPFFGGKSAVKWQILSILIQQALH